ncbi:MAG: hypothetical protein DRO88_02645 [Promethearchaeia archaeon]|nr:MAG: hypothetical protein DRO88_02645 [Candidatus Lokiarchaeia archaeon]
MYEKTNKLIPEVAQYWSNNSNCAQSCAAGILERFQFNSQAQVCYHSFYPFGGGFDEGDVCGIVSGCLAALSYLLHSQGFDKDNIFDKSAQFRKKFHDKFSSITCYGLTNEFRDENHQTIEERESDRKKRCDEAIIFGTNLILSLLEPQEEKEPK